MRFACLKRREFITFIGLATALPLAVHAQQAAKIPRIGILSPGRPSADPIINNINSFLQGLRELGYTEGQNVTIQPEFAEGNADRLSELANKLIAAKVDVIVAFSTTAARAAKQATSTIPIVAIAMADPVADGLVASLARPGGNVTGTTFLGPELVAKRLQLLQEVVPGLSRVAVLWHPQAYSERTMAGVVNEIEVAARTLGLQLQLVPAASADDFAGAFAAIPVLLDAVYDPWPTPLAAAVGAAGGRVINGLRMLLHQAFSQVEQFTGLPAPRAAMEAALS